MSGEEAWIASFMSRTGGAESGALSDLEALRLREDLRILPLQRNARSLLEDLPALGAADFTTGNACATCTRREAVQAVLPQGEGTAVFGASGGLRWLDGSWRHSAAILSRSMDFTDTPPCLLFFGETGALAHQVTLPDPGTWEAFLDLVRRHQGCWTCLELGAATPRPEAARNCPAWMVREAWCSAVSERDLDVRLAGLGVDRLLALRLLEGLYTTPVPVQDLAALLEGLAASRLPVHVQLGNRHCTQVLEATLDELTLEPEGWIIQMAQATLRLDPERMDSLWCTVHPGPGGERHRFEGYGADGERVLALSCPSNPEPLVHLGWQRLVGQFEGRVGGQVQGQPGFLSRQQPAPPGLAQAR